MDTPKRADVTHRCKVHSSPPPATLEPLSLFALKQHRAAASAGSPAQAPALPLASCVTSDETLKRSASVSSSAGGDNGAPRSTTALLGGNRLIHAKRLGLNTFTFAGRRGNDMTDTSPPQGSAYLPPRLPGTVAGGGGGQARLLALASFVPGLGSPSRSPTACPWVLGRDAPQPGSSSIGRASTDTSLDLLMRSDSRSPSRPASPHVLLPRREWGPQALRTHQLARLPQRPARSLSSPAAPTWRGGSPRSLPLTSGSPLPACLPPRAGLCPSPSCSRTEPGQVASGRSLPGGSSDPGNRTKVYGLFSWGSS